MNSQKCDRCSCSAIADIVKYVSGRVEHGRSLLIDYLKMNDQQRWQITAIALVGNPSDSLTHRHFHN
ncbi:hypothetical protein [Nostoc sp.]|uniref:hypothetical protein n=1 Tax=Nostoc sp. TaxID=1180 RepID=UPI002FF4E065